MDTYEYRTLPCHEYGAGKRPLRRLLGELKPNLASLLTCRHHLRSDLGCRCLVAAGEREAGISSHRREGGFAKYKSSSSGVAAAVNE